MAETPNLRVTRSSRKGLDKKSTPQLFPIQTAPASVTARRTRKRLAVEECDETATSSKKQHVAESASTKDVTKEPKRQTRRALSESSKLKTKIPVKTSSSSGTDSQDEKKMIKSSKKKSPKPSVKPPKQNVKSSEQTVNSPKPSVKSPNPSVKNPEKSVKSPKPSVKSPKPSVKSPKTSVESPKPSVKSPKPSVKSPKTSVESPKPSVKSSKKSPKVADKSSKQTGTTSDVIETASKRSTRISRKRGAASLSPVNTPSKRRQKKSSSLKENTDSESDVAPTGDSSQESTKDEPEKEKSRPFNLKKDDVVKDVAVKDNVVKDNVVKDNVVNHETLTIETITENEDLESDKCNVKCDFPETAEQIVLPPNENEKQIREKSMLETLHEEIPSGDIAVDDKPKQTPHKPNEQLVVADIHLPFDDEPKKKIDETKLTLEQRFASPRKDVTTLRRSSLGIGLNKRRSSFIRVRFSNKLPSIISKDLCKQIPNDLPDEKRLEMLTKSTLEYTLQQLQQEFQDINDAESLEEKVMHAGEEACKKMVATGLFKHAVSKGRTAPNPINVEVQRLADKMQEKMDRYEEEAEKWDEMLQKQKALTTEAESLASNVKQNPLKDRPASLSSHQCQILNNLPNCNKIIDDLKYKHETLTLQAFIV
ncbi:unnamed protein product [Owenia fusiformis]|uniref:Uncharacterized protein n=1 Tax=Owenia fusiformis TaxID=6347 RepID=A0A8J1UZ53_OWEFU|nr:unnamed protein product [Owenia fusiformis]